MYSRLTKFRVLVIASIFVGSLIIYNQLLVANDVRERSPNSTDSEVSYFSLRRDKCGQLCKFFQLKESRRDIESRSNCGYLMFRSNSGLGLGNLMFAYASLIGLASLNHRTPMISKEHYNILSKYFQLSSNIVLIEDLNGDINSFTPLKETFCCKVDDRLLNLPCGEDLELQGYLQSRIYFQNIQTEIKRDFQLKPELRTNCTAYVDEQLAKFDRSHQNDRTRCALIGVYPRRGDFTTPEKISVGHHAATSEYMRSAIALYESIFENITCLVFIIAGNDHQWNRELIDSYSPKHPDRTLFLVLPDQFDVRDQGFDMCILSICDHIIMFSGIYGWWVSYLTDGLVIYQSEYARFGSRHYDEYNSKTYFMLTWTPL